MVIRDITERKNGGGSAAGVRPIRGGALAAKIGCRTFDS